MEIESVDRQIRAIIEHIRVSTEPIRQLGLNKITDDSQRHAIRVILNCADVLSGNALPKVTNAIIDSSYKLGEIHLIHNIRLNPQQRKNFESWVFEPKPVYDEEN